VRCVVMLIFLISHVIFSPQAALPLLLPQPFSQPSLHSLSLCCRRIMMSCLILILSFDFILCGDDRMPLI
jgi:hypothetical protein